LLQELRKEYNFKDEWGEGKSESPEDGKSG
jgi:hypothetical protein